MAALADHYFPSKEEIEIIQSEIIALENEVLDTQKVIERAQLRIDVLTQRLNERKSKIAPVRKASFDVLSSIFERCSEIYWRSPLAIGAVSRRWREVILHTPRAWCFIDISNLNRACTNAYLERSGQCGLHVALAHPDEVELITRVAHRVRCLVIPLLPHYLETLTFPRLTRLRSQTYDKTAACCHPAMITPSRFPNLRHLELRNELYAVDNCEKLPSLQTLKITVFDDAGWSELLKACNEILVSLQITCPPGVCTAQVPQVELPNLRYLKVVDEAQEGCSWMSTLVTPALRVYWGDYWKAHESRERPHITHLRLRWVPSTFPTQLRVLQLDISIEEFRYLINELKIILSRCPHLETIEFGQTYPTDNEVTEIATTLEQWDGQVLPELVRSPTISAGWNWSVGLPDEIEVEVRDC